MEKVLEQGNFRQSMSWLHTWGSLVAGWVLFCIFLTGAIGVFDDDITHWMNPEQKQTAVVDPASLTQSERAAMVEMGQRYLQEVMPEGHFWAIGLPSEDHPVIRLFWQDMQENPGAQLLDPLKGEPLPAEQNRQTEGGHHFVHMHFELHAGQAGIWLVGFFTMIMLVALVSGIIIHRRIFKDFFTLRFSKGQRSWLDAHNVSSVITLPFQLMIAYTGLAVFVAVYMPAAMYVNYQNPEDFFSELFEEPPHQAETGIKAEVVSLTNILLQGEQLLGRPASFVTVEHPGDSSARARVFGLFDPDEAFGKLVSQGSGRAMFNATNGQLMHHRMPGQVIDNPAYSAQQIMRRLHFANYGGYTVRWLYFLLGLAGAVMIASGSILFMVKRRQKALNEFGRHTARVYRGIEALNIAAITGLAIACVGFLWINRLLPLEVDMRAVREIQLFFLLWFGTFLHAILRPAISAWREQLWLFASLCLLLPILNWITTGDQLISYIGNNDWRAAGVELAALLLGLLALYSVRHLRQRQARQQADCPTRASIQAQRGIS
ncbi:PepSY-associated TM helix domain-containing protein [Methylophaga lonarensis]|uniref:PepSY-associated TM helix domain-containing protein n=1 Tax=Methylophaga lonarensis TaxID=999151 RepID=UPI003D268225